jgi:hypothetical protein
MRKGSEVEAIAKAKATANAKVRFNFICNFLLFGLFYKYMFKLQIVSFKSCYNNESTITQQLITNI